MTDLRSKPAEKAAEDGADGAADKAAAVPAKQQKTVRTVACSSLSVGPCATPVLCLDDATTKVRRAEALARGFAVYHIMGCFVQKELFA